VVDVINRFICLENDEIFYSDDDDDDDEEHSKTTDDDDDDNDEVETVGEMVEKMRRNIIQHQESIKNPSVVCFQKNVCFSTNVCVLENGKEYYLPA
jgi:hypothetical protein